MFLPVALPLVALTFCTHIAVSPNNNMFWGLSVLVLIGKPCSLSACVVLHYVAVRLFIRAFGDAHLDFFVVVIKNSTAKQYP